ncbi:MAG: 16S rRNA (guanine(527)-N(7))-methyltransferase RsmG [Clostridia bacterium]|nr:16S rRNA (guanine(527)-N(7))-methyltransferase RsmG [Clostridia bacterium]
MTEETLRAAMPDVTQDQADKFVKYYNLLLKWNAKVNLTRITLPEEVAQKHFADSVLGASLIPEGARVVDVGTGAGFPGVPLKIVRPDIELVLVDSLGKRINFLRELCGAIGVDAETIHARAEDAARDPKLREGFDIALSRAVAPMNILTELTLPFVKVGGASLMYKGSGAAEEIAASENAFRELNCAAEPIAFDVPWGARSIVAARKLAPTKKKYPRKAGFVEKAPL